MKSLKLMADYGCYPLWRMSCDDPANVNPRDLPLSADLRDALEKWAAAYDRTLNQDYPPDSGFAGPEEEKAFDTEGQRLWKELQLQLGADYQVSYYCDRQATLLEPSLREQANQTPRPTGESVDLASLTHPSERPSE